MTVEKRYSKRYPLACDVYIRYRKQRAFPAKAQDCSLYGMSLKTESLTLLSGSMVELDIFFNQRKWEITALVTHTQQNCLGVMFWDPQHEFYQQVIAAAGLEQDQNQTLAARLQPIDLLSDTPPITN